MMIEVLKSKIHCARVTEANLNYMGSITIDEDLLDAANMIAGEKVYIADNNNGERFETYIIKGERGSGKICLNGAAARKVQPDDIIIIMSYALMDFEEAKSFKPSVIFPDPANGPATKRLVILFSSLTKDRQDSLTASPAPSSWSMPVRSSHTPARTDAPHALHTPNKCLRDSLLLKHACRLVLPEWNVAENRSSPVLKHPRFSINS